MLFTRHSPRRFALSPRYGLFLTWLMAGIGVLAAMRFTALMAQ